MKLQGNKDEKQADLSESCTSSKNKRCLTLACFVHLFTPSNTRHISYTYMYMHTHDIQYMCLCVTNKDQVKLLLVALIKTHLKIIVYIL